MGHGPEVRVTIRIFRGDEPEIVEYVEQWRVLICAYLISKCDTIGSLHLPVGLSKIGAYVSRPIGMYMECIIFLKLFIILSLRVVPSFRIFLFQEVSPIFCNRRNHLNRRNSFIDDGSFPFYAS